MFHWGPLGLVQRLQLTRATIFRKRPPTDHDPPSELVGHFFQLIVNIRPTKKVIRGWTVPRSTHVSRAVTDLASKIGPDHPYKTETTHE